MRIFQNLSSDPSSWITLANTHVFELLSMSVIKEGNEQKAAIGTIFNLLLDPGAIIPLTNTKNILGTLVCVAHNINSPDYIVNMTCNCLSIISLWIHSFAGTGAVP